MTREEYIDRVTRWFMPGKKDPDLDADARASPGLSDVYTGKSAKIHRLVRLAYLRGVRRGAGVAWSARKPVVTRESSAPTCAGWWRVKVHGRWQVVFVHDPTGDGLEVYDRGPVENLPIEAWGKRVDMPDDEGAP